MWRVRGTLWAFDMVGVADFRMGEMKCLHRGVQSMHYRDYVFRLFGNEPDFFFETRGYTKCMGGMECMHCDIQSMCDRDCMFHYFFWH